MTMSIIFMVTKQESCGLRKLQLKGETLASEVAEAM